MSSSKYGKAVLKKFGVESSVDSKIAQTENVHAMLKLLSTGEALLDICLQTDVTAASSVKIVGIFSEDSHPPIIYSVVVTDE